MLTVQKSGAQLEKGQTYILTVSCEGYVTHTEMLTADGSGQTTTVELEEFKKRIADFGNEVVLELIPINKGSFQMGSECPVTDFSKV